MQTKKPLLVLNGYSSLNTPSPHHRPLLEKYFDVEIYDHTKNYAEQMKKMYDEDLIYKIPEQHDSYVWDYVRKEFENRGTKNFNIGDGKPGHVQARSILGVVYDHTKGPRKLKGRSPEARV